jgi:hypothetical protein
VKAPIVEITTINLGASRRATGSREFGRDHSANSGLGYGFDHGGMPG